MKPIPAIDEAGNWVEAELTNGAKMTLLAIGECCAITLQGEYGVRVPPDIFKDWPAVRERVERARAKRVSDQVIRDLADSGRAFVRIDPSAVLTHTTAPTPPRKPSFAEALEREIANDLSRVDRNPNRPVTPAMLYDWLLSARAASGE